LAIINSVIISAMSRSCPAGELDWRGYATVRAVELLGWNAETG